jgi:hypothetical protein
MIDREALIDRLMVSEADISDVEIVADEILNMGTGFYKVRECPECKRLVNNFEGCETCNGTGKQREPITVGEVVLKKEFIALQMEMRDGGYKEPVGEPIDTWDISDEDGWSKDG